MYVHSNAIRYFHLHHFCGGEYEKAGKWVGEEENVLWFYQKSTKGTLSSLSRDADVVNFYSRQILARNTVEL